MKLFVALLLACFAGHAHAAGNSGGGSEVGNGGGIAEKNLEFARLSLDKYIALCLETPLCRIDEKERKLLNDIAASLVAEKKQDLVFRSSKKTPEFFKIDGVIRVAKTGNQIGDTIFINTDLLYSEVTNAEFRATDVPLATSILLHELGHHHGVSDHARLDRMGAKVQSLLLADSERSSFWNGHASIASYQLNHVHSDDDKAKLQKIDELVLENDSDLYPLDTEIAKAIICTGKPKARVIGLRLYNLYGERGVTFDEKTKVLSKPFRMWYVSSCEEGKESDHGDLVIDLRFKKITDSKFQFLRDETRVRQISCAQDKSVCK